MAEVSSATSRSAPVRRRRPAPLPQPPEPAVHPVIRTYLLSGDHGTLRRYLLELCLIVGLIIPWFGPLLGLCGIAPLIDLDIMERAVITPSSSCYSTAGNGTVCDDRRFYEYHFWNLTNAEQVGQTSRLRLSAKYSVLYALGWPDKRASVRPLRVWGLCSGYQEQRRPRSKSLDHIPSGCGK